MTPDDVETINRRAYDTVAVDYARQLEGLSDDLVWDRAVLAAYAEVVLAGDRGPVLDVGCGPGRITARLADLGLDVRGIDLSPAMVAEARRRRPDIPCAEGRFDDLGVAPGSLAGAVAWYSLIHVPPERRPAALASLAAALRPDGHLLLAFQVGDEHRMLTHAYGHDVVIEVWRLDPAAITAELATVGLAVVASVRRAPAESEKVDQAYLLARKVRDRAD